MEIEERLEADVLVCSDHAYAKLRTMALAEQIAGVRALDGGPLANSRYLEEFTALLLSLNKNYKAHTALRIVGIPAPVAGLGAAARPLHSRRGQRARVGGAPVPRHRHRRHP